MGICGYIDREVCFIAVEKGVMSRGSGRNREHMNKVRCLVVVHTRSLIKCQHGFERNVCVEIWHLWFDGKALVHCDPEGEDPRLLMWCEPDECGRNTLRFMFEYAYYSLPRVTSFVSNNPMCISQYAFLNTSRGPKGGKKMLDEFTEDEVRRGLARNRYYEADHRSGDPRKVLWEDLELVVHFENERRENQRRAQLTGRGKSPCKTF